MQYSIRHITRFKYQAPISESIMEVRMCPRTDARQQCYSFELHVTPHAQLYAYQDFTGNTIHHFDIPSPHEALKLESRALVEVQPSIDVPDSVPASAWDDLDAIVNTGEHLEMTMPSAYVQSSGALSALREELGIVRRDDPLSLLHELNAAIYDGFEYRPQSTHVKSPIDDALRIRSGVCQDFAHIFIALVRPLGIPCRYVSGYLYHRKHGPAGGDRSAEDGSHAWVEAYLPALGWIGFDPTNNVLGGGRHIRVALGRDYDDVSPTRGTFKGSARTTLHVGVHVAKAQFPVRHEVEPELALVIQNGDLEAAGIPAKKQQAQQ